MIRVKGVVLKEAWATDYESERMIFYSTFPSAKRKWRREEGRMVERWRWQKECCEEMSRGLCALLRSWRGVMWSVEEGQRDKELKCALHVRRLWTKRVKIKKIWSVENLRGSRRGGYAYERGEDKKGIIPWEERVGKLGGGRCKSLQIRFYFNNLLVKGVYFNIGDFLLLFIQLMTNSDSYKIFIFSQSF